MNRNKVSEEINNLLTDLVKGENPESYTPKQPLTEHEAKVFEQITQVKVKQSKAPSEAQS